MPILDLNDKVQIDKYNNFLENNNASLMQSISWIKVKKEWKNEIVYLEENNEIIASMLVLFKKVPLFNKYLAYAPRGPICDINNIELVKKLIKELELLNKKYKVFVFKFDPEIVVDEDLKTKYLNEGFKLKTDNDVIQPKFNMILDLENETEESLMKRFSSKTRYNIRLAKRKDVTVRYSNSEEDLKKFYEIYKVTTIRDKIGCRNYEYFKDMLESFGNENIRIYLAEHENEVLASAICINHGKKAFYLYGASSNNKRNLMPNYLLQFEMIKWGLENNCNKYDFGGVFILNNSNGLFKFKYGFCKNEGATEFIGEIDKVYDKVIYYIYNNIFPKISKFKKKLRSIFKPL